MLFKSKLRKWGQGDDRLREAGRGDRQPKSLIRMFGPRGNPQAKNLFSVLGYLQRQAGLELHVTTGPAWARSDYSGEIRSQIDSIWGVDRAQNVSGSQFISRLPHPQL